MIIESYYLMITIATATAATAVTAVTVTAVTATAVATVKSKKEFLILDGSSNMRNKSYMMNIDYF